MSIKMTPKESMDFTERRIQAGEKEFERLFNAMEHDVSVAESNADLCGIAIQLYLDKWKMILPIKDFVELVYRIRFDYSEWFEKYNIDY